MKKLSIVFAGTPAFALPCLEALQNSSNHLTAIYTQPDRPAGRGQKMQFSAVKQWALDHNISIYQPINFKDAKAVDELKALKPDVMIVIAYGLILPQKVLNIPRFGCINVHGSILPRWRGASPIQHSLLHGDSESGVTIMQMDSGMDTGNMLATAKCTLDAHETAATLHDKLALIAVEPLLQTITNLSTAFINAKPQDNTKATYANKINKEDGLINWNQPMESIDQQIRAFNPWPIAFTHAGNEVMRIYEATPDDTRSGASPGTILLINKQGLLVATGTKSLLINRIQFPGGKVITIADWLNAKRTQLVVGMILNEK